MQLGLIDLSWWAYALVILGLTHVTIASVTIFLHRHQAHRALELHPVASHFFRFSTASKEQWVNPLEGWRQRAEESGILALQEFSRKLRCYD